MIIDAIDFKLSIIKKKKNRAKTCNITEQSLNIIFNDSNERTLGNIWIVKYYLIN